MSLIMLILFRFYSAFLNRPLTFIYKVIAG